MSTLASTAANISIQRYNKASKINPEIFLGVHAEITLSETLNQQISEQF